MTDELLIRRYLRAKRKLEKKLDDIEQKLDHLLFRIREEDPRIYSRSRKWNDEDDEDLYSRR